jgi:hypothetical protein
MPIRLPHPLLLILFLLAFAAYGYSAFGVFTNPDTPWHIASGDYILAHGLPATDPWSYSAGDFRWYNISWLWDVLITLIFHAGGAAGLFFFTCAFGALNVTVLGWSLQRRGQAGDTYIILTCGLFWLCQLVMLYPQPQLVTFLFTILFHHILHTHRRDGTLDPKRAVWLFILSVLWVNIHGGLITALTLFGAYGLAAFETKQWPWLRTLVKLGVIMLAACLLNPYHIFFFEGVYRTLNGSIEKYLIDWHPVDFGNLALGAPLGLFFISSNVRESRIPLADRILAFAWLFAALGAQRNMPIFLLVAAPYLAFNLQEFARATQRDKFKNPAIVADTPAMRARFTAAACALLLLALLPFSRALLLPPEKLDTDPNRLKPALAFLKAHYPNARIINDYNLGGAIIYQSEGTLPTLIDGRSGTAFPKPVQIDYLAFATGSPADAAKIVEKYHADALLLLNGNLRASSLPAPAESWKQAYRNEKLVLFVKK